MSVITVPVGSSFRKNVAEFAIEFLKIGLVIKPLQFLFKRRTQQYLLRLKMSPQNTIGNDIFRLLDKDALKPIPFFEEHDLKHLILGYGMSSEEEVRMQCYLLGNGNRSMSCLLFVLSGLLLPSCWKTFYDDYNKGKKSKNILNLKLEDCLHLSTTEIQHKYKNSKDK
ncbi:MAG: hypothetical protein RL757_1538 [Bacteroidota bacterium]|jgi:hypothetical protein